jgi:predicted nuclease of predicted toxin-antitoxin system
MEVLEYLSLLTGKPVTKMIATAVNNWLTTNYADTVADAEFRNGVPGTIILTRTGNLSPRKSYEQMKVNMRMLTVR